MTALPVQATQVPADAAQDLEPRIRFAHSEGELDALVEEIQAGFEAGHLSQDEAERLTYLSIEVARQLECGLANIPASAFLGAP